MTGGSGAAAILLTDGTLGNPSTQRHKVKGGVVNNTIRHWDLCYWGFEDKGMPTQSKVIMRTDAQKVLDHGTGLAMETYKLFRKEMNLPEDKPDKFVAHQVGEGHHHKFYTSMKIDRKKDFITFPFLGNVGSVSLPISAAIADERGFFVPGDFVAFLGVGSGLNCYFLGVEW
jgi:3-oxoacyl-[acyl-carrier-protein] synthase-3